MPPAAARQTGTLAAPTRAGASAALRALAEPSSSHRLPATETAGWEEDRGAWECADRAREWPRECSRPNRGAGGAQRRRLERFRVWATGDPLISAAKLHHVHQAGCTESLLGLLMLERAP